MIWLTLGGFGAVVWAAFFLWLYGDSSLPPRRWLGEGRRARYARTLSNIDRLERELFPEWFERRVDPKVGALEHLIGPGQKWAVPSPDSVRVIPNPYTALEHKRAIDGSFYGVRVATTTFHLSAYSGGDAWCA